MSFKDTEVFSTEDSEVSRFSTKTDIVVMTQQKAFNFFGEYIKQSYIVTIQINGKTEYIESETYGAASISFRYYAREIIKSDPMLSDLIP